MRTARFLASDSERRSRCSFSRCTSSLWYAAASALLCNATGRQGQKAVNTEFLRICNRSEHGKLRSASSCTECFLSPHHMGQARLFACPSNTALHTSAHR